MRISLLFFLGLSHLGSCFILHSTFHRALSARLEAAQAEDSNFKITATTGSVPQSEGFYYRDAQRRIALAAGIIGAQALAWSPSSSHAVGDLFEFRDVGCVLQDVSFNVQNSFAEAELLRVLLQDTCKILRSAKSSSNGKDTVKMNVTTVGFGPDMYKMPAGFRPGVSSLSEYGGHSTLTFNAKISDGGDSPTEIFSAGNGLQYIKIGTEQLRISKGVDAGGKVSFAYGWVDMATPGGVPLELVVGVAADPLMLACLRCTSVSDSVDFFTEELGMTPLEFPHARQVGSNFEPQLPTGAAFLSYGPGQFGLLLVPTLDAKRDKKILPPNFNPSKNTGPVDVGSVLDCFKIVVDDGNKGGKNVARVLPPAAKRLLESGDRDSIVISPDGYRFRLQRFSDWEKQLGRAK